MYYLTNMLDSEWKSFMCDSFSYAFYLQFDVTSYQGVLFVFCMVMFISGLVLALVLPFQYVSTTRI